MQSKTEKKLSFREVFFKEKYSDSSFVNLAKKCSNDELLKFLRSHREKLKNMSSKDQIQEFIVLIVTKDYYEHLNKNKYLNYEDDDNAKQLMKGLVEIFKVQLKTIFNIEDLISLSSQITMCPKSFAGALKPIIVNGNQLGAILGNKRYSVNGTWNDSFKYNFALEMKHVISNGDELDCVLDTFKNKTEGRQFFIEEVEKNWAKTWVWKCYFDFMTGANDEEATSFHFFHQNTDVAKFLGRLIYDVIKLNVDSMGQDDNYESCNGEDDFFLAQTRRRL